MLFDWIKIRVTIRSDPKIIKIGQILAESSEFWSWFTGRCHATAPEVSRDTVVTATITESVAVAALLQVWGMARRDGQREWDDIVVTHSSLATIDRLAGVPGFGNVMQEIGWVIVEEGGRLRFPKLLPNITSPEERAREKAADRKRRHRDAERDNGRSTHCDTERDTERDTQPAVSRECPTEVTPREEKRREEKTVEEKNTPLADTPATRRNTADTPGKARGGAAGPTYTLDFQRFWSAYPNPKNKAEAFKAWQKLRPDEATIALLLQAVERQKQSRDWQQEGGRFIPYPASWLNGRRWEDGAPAPLPAGGAAPDPAAKAAYDALLARQIENNRLHEEEMERDRKRREANGGSLFGDRLRLRPPQQAALAAPQSPAGPEVGYGEDF